MSAVEQGTELEGQYPCKDCGQVFKTLPELGTHSRTCEARKKRLEEEKRRAPPEGVYKEEADANRILREILEGHPDISPKHTNEILSWAQLKGELHPFEVAHLLSNMRGISSQTASIVSQKYSVALQKAVSEGTAQIRMPLAFPPAMQPAGQFPMISMPSMSQQYPPTAPSYWPTPVAPTMPATVPGMPTTTGYPPTPMPFVTEERLAKILKEREEKSETEKLKERMEKMDRDFAGALTSLKDDIFKRLDEREVPGVQYEEVQEYIDAKGNICHPDKAVSVRVRRVPIREERKTMLEQFKELKDAGIITTPKDMMDMLEKRKPAVESIEEHPTFKSMREKLEEYKGALDEYKKDYEKLKDTMADEERKRMQSTITKLEDRITDLTTRGTGEWRSDEMRVISGLLTDIKDLLKERKPITEVKDILVPQGVTPARPPSERAGEAERGGVLEELGKKGLVRVVERLRR